MPISECLESMPDNLKVKAFQVSLIEQNSALLDDLRDPQIATFVANKFENILTQKF